MNQPQGWLVGNQFEPTAGVYRRRLIDAGVIEPAGHGRIDSAVPRFREFLCEQAGDQVRPRLRDR